MRIVPSKFNLGSILILSGFLLIYVNFGRGFLSWRNFVIFVLGSVFIFSLIIRSNSSLIKATFTVALIPIIPDPLQGMPICSLLILICLLLYGSVPQLREGKKLLTFVSTNLLVIFISLIFAIFTTPLPGNLVTLMAWIYGIILILMSIGIFPRLTSSKELIKFFWLGASISCMLGTLLYFFPDKKIPGISVSVNYVYEIGGQNFGRYSGVLGDYELYGQFCGIATCLSLYVGLTSIRFRNKLFGYLTALVSIQQLLLTGTRSSLIVCAIASSILIARVLRSDKKSPFDMVFLPVAFVLSVAYFQIAINRSGSILRLKESARNLSHAFSTDRGDTWQFFLSQINAEFIKIPEHIQFPVYLYGTLPHSLPITLIFMFGLIPFICFYAVALAPFFILSWRSSLDEFILKLMLSQILFESIKVEATRLPQFLTVFFTLIGLCYLRSVEKIRERKPSLNLLSS